MPPAVSSPRTHKTTPKTTTVKLRVVAITLPETQKPASTRISRIQCPV